ncbi:MAG TPA: BON domain-containing protein [Pirellulales bacterium]|nr:BON domain-containing protein [Pirellulales bacterium]
MFTLSFSNRPNSVLMALVDLQVQRWQAVQENQRSAPPSAVERPQASAQARLQASPFLPLRHLRCEGDSGNVTIRGGVPTQYLKDLSALLVRSIDGVRRVTNEVEVLPLGWGNQAHLAGGL